jgi:hypothetical protein
MDLNKSFQKDNLILKINHESMVPIYAGEFLYLYSLIMLPRENVKNSFGSNNNKRRGKIISYLETTDKEFQKHFNLKKLSEICRIADPDWSRIQFGQWIRIRNPDPDPGGQK